VKPANYDSYPDETDGQVFHDLGPDGQTPAGWHHMLGGDIESTSWQTREDATYALAAAMCSQRLYTSAWLHVGIGDVEGITEEVYLHITESGVLKPRSLPQKGTP
jgi:hypothetical protein